MNKKQKRPGPAKDAVLNLRIAEMIAVLANRPTIHRVQLHAEFCKRWGVHWKTVDRAMGRAREEIMQRLGRTKEQFRAESLAFYEAKTADPKASVADQVKARHRVDDLLGLDAPKKQEISGPKGSPIELEHKIGKPIDYGRMEGLAKNLFGVPDADRNG